MKETNCSILFTDIVGFSRLRKQVGDNRSFQILEHHDHIMFDSIKMYRGEVVKTIGDSVMAAFDSPVNAAKCAVSIQHGLFRYNSKLADPLEKIPPVRMGMCYGVMDEMMRFGQKDFMGGIVDKASRVQGLANGGQILITETELGIIETRMTTNTIAFHSHGQYELRNIGKAAIVELLYKYPGENEFIPPQPLSAANQQERAQEEKAEILTFIQSIRLSGTNPKATKEYKEKYAKNQNLTSFSAFLQFFSEKERNWSTQPDEIQALCEFGIDTFNSREDWSVILETFAKSLYRLGMKYEAERLLQKAFEMLPADPRRRSMLSDTLKKIKLANQAGPRLRN